VGDGGEENDATRWKVVALVYSRLESWAAHFEFRLSFGIVLSAAGRFLTRLKYAAFRNNGR